MKYLEWVALIYWRSLCIKEVVCAVKYEIKGEIGSVMFCHCSRCRKANGSAFNAASLVKTADFKLVSGHEHLAEFESGASVWRVFCKTCGSPLYSRRSAMPDAIRLRVGTLEHLLRVKWLGISSSAQKQSGLIFWMMHLKLQKDPDESTVLY